MSKLAHGLFLAAAFVATLATAATSQDPRWPREYTQRDGSKLTIYQPQVNEWTGFRKLKAEAALAVQIPGQEQPLIGSLQLSADTQTDHDNRVVMVDNLQVVKIDFPGQDPAQTQALARTVRLSLPKQGMEVPLDRILANLERSKVLDRQVELSNAPPKIIVSRKPAILIVLDGKPMLEPITGTDLSTVLNTSSDLFHHDKTSRFYLLDEDSWLTAEQLTGDWVAAGDLPADFQKLPEMDPWAEVRKHVAQKPLVGTEVLVVYVSEEPAELIVTLGEPQFQPVPGTKLLYVTNTESDIFLCGSDGKYYTLISGRWFRSLGMGLPVEFCTNDLPEDFKNIPEDLACGRVLVSVPGTQQAQEALYAAQIPRQAKVQRNNITVQVTYTGDPEFKLIAGTKVECATNTSFDVFRWGRRYYVCYQAVWFESATSKGPWAVCDRVPPEIYQIPASSDKYNVTYVQVFDSTPDYVVYGYYPGYYGCYAWGGVMVYGCGYYRHHSAAYWSHYYHYGYRHWHRHPAHYTYGGGYYYDHLDGRFRSHWAGRHPDRVASNPYRAWGKGVTYRGSSRRGAEAREAAARRPGRQPAARRDLDLHVGKDGAVYRRQGSGWQRYDKGTWRSVGQEPQRRPETGRPTPRTPRQPAPTPTSSQRQDPLDRSYRSRSEGSKRPSQYETYRNSRGTRTGGSRGGGGMRGGGRRR